MSQEKNIHWYPGHMQKAYHELEKKIKVVDLVIEVIDARAVFSSLNPLLNKLVQRKNHLLLINKTDVADKIVFVQQIDQLKKDFNYVVDSSLLDSKEIGRIKKMIHEIHVKKREKQIRKGMIPQPVRVMIVGIPNVGKSTLINRMVGKKVARVENRPGLTRSEQWIKVNPEFDLLDSPGVLNKNYENEFTRMNLALINAIPLSILPQEEIAYHLVDFLRDKYFELLVKYIGFQIKKDTPAYDIFEGIALKRGFKQNNELDISRAQILFIKDFQNGVIGKISLEK